MQEELLLASLQHQRENKLIMPIIKIDIAETPHYNVLVTNLLIIKLKDLTILLTLKTWGKLKSVH